MKLIQARNVNEALYLGVQLLKYEGRSVAPRGLPTVETPYPVATVYRRPMERVLFSELRDANPFLHFFEAMWMLQGRKDVAFLTQFVSRFGEYSDDGSSLHGAYGFRWRSFFGTDQIDNVITRLGEDPYSRKAVIGMYSPAVDSQYTGRDLPCNTTIYFKSREGVLNMTVCCRSNDIIWGAYGANAVHFSFLQEYIANKLELEVGNYVQLSDSFHAYTSGPGGDLWAKLSENESKLLSSDLYYAMGPDMVPTSMGAKDENWDADLAEMFVRWDNQNGDITGGYRTPWFKGVVVPMWDAFTHRKGDPLRAAEAISSITAKDWRYAVQAWVSRRGNGSKS